METRDNSPQGNSSEDVARRSPHGQHWRCASIPIKLLMTAAAALLLSGAVNSTRHVKMAQQDVLVYCTIYCGWVIFFLPHILLYLDVRLLGKIIPLLLRLYFAELAVGLYLYMKGEPDLLQRGLSLRPLLAPSCQWMVEFVHSTRFVLVVGCVSASVVAHLFDRPEVLNDYSLDDNNVGRGQRFCS